MYSLLASHVLAPALDFFGGTRTMKYLKELKESQWWSRDRILELQNQRLRQLIGYAYGNVPYYRRVFSERGLKPDDIESGKDLVKLPVLTKQLIRSNFDDLMARGFPVKERVQLSTGGSTGEPLLFYDTRDDHMSVSFASGQRASSAIGFAIGDKTGLLTIVYPYQSRSERFWRIPINFLLRRQRLDAKEMSRETVPLFVKKLQHFQPKFIRGYPSAIYELAQSLKSKGKFRIRPKAIITNGEQLYDYQRRFFREVFGCDTFDHYYSNEANCIAFECPQHSGYHIAAENVIVEIVDDEGKTLPAGKEGRILVTNLHNYAMPFIRYDIGDLGVGSDRACPCGRGLPLLASLNGRTCDVILTPSKGPIPGMNLPWNFFAHWGVEQFQIVQETYEKVVIKLVPGEEYPKNCKDELSREIVRQWRPILGEDMDMAVEFVEQIPLTGVGKRRVVISHVLTGDRADSGP